MDTLERINRIINKGWSLVGIRDGTFLFKKSNQFSSIDHSILYHYGFLKDDVWYNEVSFEDDWDDKFYKLFLLKKEASDNWNQHIKNRKEKRVSYGKND
jgi:hypothetical protein